jgi:hypothetical protein
MSVWKKSSRRYFKVVCRPCFRVVQEIIMGCKMMMMMMNPSCPYFKVVGPCFRVGCSRDHHGVQNDDDDDEFIMSIF